MKKHKHLLELASLDGLGVTSEIIADYTTPESFRYVCPTGHDVICHRVIVSIGDATITDSSKYGGINALTNGIELSVRHSDDSLIETLTPFPIKTNGDWARICYDTVVLAGLGVGTDYVAIRWTFSKSGHPIVLSGGQYIEVVAQDDFTGLDNHSFFFQGYYTTNDYSFV